MVTAVTESPLITLEGVPITLTFTLTDSLPPVQANSSDWSFMNGTHTLTPVGPRFSFSADFLSLTINPVEATDEGTYMLRVTNDAELMGSASIMVDVQCKWF